MELAEKILSATDLKREAVEVPEWGVTVYVSTMGGRTRHHWRESAFDDESGKSKPDKVVGWLLVHCLTDETGKPVFEPTEENALKLEDKNEDVLNRLFDAAVKLNGLTPKAVDDAEKK